MHRIPRASEYARPSRTSRWAWGALAVAVLFGGYSATVPHPAASAADDKGAKTAPKADARSEATFEVYKDKGGEFRWRLRAANSQVIATSGQGYKEKRGCLEGIESVQKHAPSAKVEEVAETKP